MPRLTPLPLCSKGLTEIAKGELKMRNQPIPPDPPFPEGVKAEVQFSSMGEVRFRLYPHLFCWCWSVSGALLILWYFKHSLASTSEMSA